MKTQPSINKKLQDAKKIALMIGGALNDAGALKKSDVGFAINENVYNFSPSCNAIILAEKFVSITQLPSFCSCSIKVVRVSNLISFLCNVVGLSFSITF